MARNWFAALAALIFACVPPATAQIGIGSGASNLQAGEIFHIQRGRITGVEAMGASLPYGTKSGWGE